MLQNLYNRFFSVDWCRPWIIWLIRYFSGQEEIKVVRDAIKQYWPDGIVDEKIKLTSEGDFPKCYQFVLSRAPFRKGNERYDTVRMRLMTTKILQSMSHLGWKVINNKKVTTAAVCLLTHNIMFSQSFAKAWCPVKLDRFCSRRLIRKEELGYIFSVFCGVLFETEVGICLVCQVS